MTRKTLQGSFDLEISCLGVFSFSNPSKLVWEVNTGSHYEFQRVTDLKVKHDGGMSYHTRFEFSYEDFGCQLIILKNKGSHIELLKNTIEIPYLLFILGEEHKSAEDEISPYLKSLQNVKAIQALDSKILNKLVAYI